MATSQIHRAFDQDMPAKGTKIHQIRNEDTPKFIFPLFQDGDSSMSQIGILQPKYSKIARKSFDLHSLTSSSPSIADFIKLFARLIIVQVTHPNQRPIPPLQTTFVKKLVNGKNEKQLLQCSPLTTNKSPALGSEEFCYIRLMF